MIALLYDTETTGLDPAVDRIVQHGAIAFDVVSRRIIDARSWLAWTRDFPVVADAEKVHGWSLTNLIKYATHPSFAIQQLNEFAHKYEASFVVAHNGLKFDKNMLHSEFKRIYQHEDCTCYSPLSLPWLDTMHHAEYPCSKSLLTIAANYRYINPFAHDALADCYTLAHILTERPTLILEMARAAATTYSLIFANVPQKYDAAMNEKLKAKKFVWQDCDGHHYDKSWIRKIERDKFAEFASTCDFPVNLIKDLPPPDEYASLLKELEDTCK